MGEPDENGPINKGAYLRTEFEGLKEGVTIEYENEAPNFQAAQYYLTHRYNNENENDDDITFIGKDYLVEVTNLTDKTVHFQSIYVRNVYVNEEGEESYDRWAEAWNVDVAGTYMNEYEYNHNAGPSFTFTKEQVDAGVDADGDTFEIFRLDRRPEHFVNHILGPEMINVRNYFMNLENGNVAAATKRIKNIMPGAALNRRMHALKFFNKTIKNQVAASNAAANKGGRRKKAQKTMKRRSRRVRRK